MLFLSVGGGLCKVTAGGLLQPYTDGELIEHGLEDALLDQARRWSECYTTFAALLPIGYKPEDCVEFELESHNAQGIRIALEAAQALDETWCVMFEALKRKQYMHLSYLKQLRNNQMQLRRRFNEWGDGTAIMDRDSSDDERFAQRWIRFLFDHCSSCLRDVSGTEDGLETLPIDPAIASQLEEEIDALRQRWEDWDFEDSMRPRFTPAFLEERQAYAREGLAIARKLKAALPSDWTVVYFDIDRAARFSQRSEFEYAI